MDPVAQPTMTQRVRKAVFPVAGLGTRFLPATKALPKEMLPIVDRPLIQYAVEEAGEAGIEDFVFVTGRGKSLIEDHFDQAYELEQVLAGRGKDRELEAIRACTPGDGTAVLHPPARAPRPRARGLVREAHSRGRGVRRRARG